MATRLSSAEAQLSLGFGEARAAARSELQRIERGQATMGYTLAQGRPEIRPELTVNVRGFKAEIDGTDWLVVRATHTISDGGLQTSLELERGGTPTAKL